MFRELVGRRVVAVLAAWFALVVLLLGAGPASALTSVGPQDVVGPHASSFQASVGLSDSVTAGPGRVPTTLYGQIVVATGVAANTADAGAGSVLRASSEAAFRAADDPAAMSIKHKHMAYARGRFAKFDSSDIGEVQGWVAEALRSERAVFRPNTMERSVKVEVDLGRPIGTKGQTGIRAIVSDDGRMLNAFPFNP